MNYNIANYYQMGYSTGYFRTTVRKTVAPRRTRRPRFGRRRRRYGRRKALVTPYSIVRRIPTSWFNSLDAGAGTLSVDIIKLNSAYDPTGSISPSLQGMGMDQYEALYNKYCVVGFKIHVQAVSTDNTNPVTVGFLPTTSSATLTTQHRYMEQNGCFFKIMTPDIDKITFTYKGSVKKHLLPRGGKLLTDDINSGATMTSDPSHILYGHIFVQTQDNTADPAAVKYTAKLEQIVVFYDPKTPARSTE